MYECSDPIKKKAHVSLNFYKNYNYNLIYYNLL